MRVLLPLEAGQSAYTRNVGCAKNMKKQTLYKRNTSTMYSFYSRNTENYIQAYLHYMGYVCVCGWGGMWDVCVCVWCL